MSLPNFQGGDQSFQLMQSAWANQLNPIIAAPANNSRIIKGVVLAIGSNVINHLLGQKLQGWTLVRKRAAANIHDTQDTNPRPELTLTLTSDAAVTVDIEVF